MKKLNSPTTPKELGNLGEKIARKYLERKKYKILSQNFERKWGEIDIVAKKKDMISFFEVKTLRSAINGHPAEVGRSPQVSSFYPEDQVSLKKKRQLWKMAQIYLSENKIPFDTPYQIDIIAVEISLDFKRAKIRHLENAIEDIY